jgi:hypothetical protein
MMERLYARLLLKIHPGWKLLAVLATPDARPTLCREKPTPLAPFFAIAPRDGVITPFHTRTPLLPGIKLASHQTLLTTVKL